MINNHSLRMVCWHPIGVGLVLEETGLQTFGVFTPLFTGEEGGVPGYLKLLGPGTDASFAIELLREAIENSGENVGKEIRDLFGHRNWRPQLVAASAMLVGNLSSELPSLWDALDQPCWTSPQLAAVASCLDPSFLDQARARLEAGCPLNLEKSADLDPLVRHSALGPTSFDGHSSKLIVTYVTLCSEQRATADWLPQLVSRPDIQRAIELDVDKAGEITTRWRNDMVALLNT